MFDMQYLGRRKNWGRGADENRP